MTRSRSRRDPIPAAERQAPRNSRRPHRQAETKWRTAPAVADAGARRTRLRPAMPGWELVTEHRQIREDRSGQSARPTSRLHQERPQCADILRQGVRCNSDRRFSFSKALASSEARAHAGRWRVVIQALGHLVSARRERSSARRDHARSRGGDRRRSMGQRKQSARTPAWRVCAVVANKARSRRGRRSLPGKG